MKGYAVVSSVRLRGPIYQTVVLCLAWLSRPNYIHGPASIVHLGGCQSSFGGEQLRSRGILFKGITSYDSWGIRLHEGDRSRRSDWSGGSIWIRYEEIHTHEEIHRPTCSLFRDTGTGLL